VAREEPGHRCYDARSVRTDQCENTVGTQKQPPIDRKINVPVYRNEARPLPPVAYAPRPTCRFGLVALASNDAVVDSATT
jgi:hypothetical protein